MPLIRPTGPALPRQLLRAQNRTGTVEQPARHLARTRIEPHQVLMAVTVNGRASCRVPLFITDVPALPRQILRNQNRTGTVEQPARHLARTRIEPRQVLMAVTVDIG